MIWSKNINEENLEKSEKKKNNNEKLKQLIWKLTWRLQYLELFSSRYVTEKFVKFVSSRGFQIQGPERAIKSRGRGVTDQKWDEVGAWFPPITGMS